MVSSIYRMLKPIAFPSPSGEGGRRPDKGVSLPRRTCRARWPRTATSESAIRRPERRTGRIGQPYLQLRSALVELAENNVEHTHVVGFNRVLNQLPLQFLHLVEGQRICQQIIDAAKSRIAEVCVLPFPIMK